MRNLLKGDNGVSRVVISSLCCLIVIVVFVVVNRVMREPADKPFEISFDSGGDGVQYHVVIPAGKVTSELIMMHTKNVNVVITSSVVDKLRDYRNNDLGEGYSDSVVF